MKASLLFESLRPAGDEKTSFQIEDPEEILTCSRLEEVGPLLHEVGQRARDGCLAAGFVTYEAGFAFLPGMPAVRRPALPLVWFAVTRNPRFLNPEETSLPDDPGEVTNLRLNRSLQQYCAALDHIKRRIERGDTYQVNYTMRYRGGFRGSAESLYRRLRSRQRVNYAALIQTPDWAVISLSPELFFRKAGKHVVMRPMKGTAARGRTLREDEQQARALRGSPKETSENLMIVDLLRNDLGKICEPGSISVRDAMQVERYETLWQMTTTIEGQLLDACGTADVFAATFPSGSVTGAPKVRTMQIIDELESEPRGVYTGAIGYLSGNDSVFNVAIRTVCIDRVTETLEMGAGSGILHEADA
ncbi:MAG TPA: anthranilate synthase component I family protein, partial [Acidobacteriota bacterium]|nr:anthranilate synthase component I family protein [Acidobacteriota bacterium]